jgi:hypothetical protein
MQDSTSRTISSRLAAHRNDADRDDKLVQLFECFAHPICAPGGDGTDKSFSSAPLFDPARALIVERRSAGNLTRVGDDFLNEATLTRELERWDNPTMVVTLDAKRRLTVPVALAPAKPGDYFDAHFDAEEDAIVFRRLARRESWLAVLKACPVSPDDVPPRRRTPAKRRKL